MSLSRIKLARFGNVINKKVDEPNRRIGITLRRYWSCEISRTNWQLYWVSLRDKLK